MNKFLWLACILFASAANAQTTLTVSSWGTPNHGINQIVWPTWGKWIAEATEGRVTLNVIQDLAPPQSQMDVIVDNIADISWIFHGLYPGRFESTKLPELPFYQDISSRQMSIAYWRVYDEYLRKANEYRGVVVLGVGVHGAGTIFSKTPINSLSDLRGKRLRTGGGIMSAIAKSLQITGVALPPTGVYEAATQNIIDGALLTLETLKSMRLADIFNYAYSVPGGLYRGSFAIVINADTWNALDAKDRQAIMSVSGEKLSQLFGAMMDGDDDKGVAFGKEKQMKFIVATDDDIAALRENSAPLAIEWIKDNANKGYDSQKAFDTFRNYIENK